MPCGSKKREVRKTYFVRSNKQVAISVQVERRWLQSMKLLDCDAISVGWESTQRPLWGVSRQKLMIALLAGHLKIRIRHYIHSMIHGEKSLKDFSWSRKHRSSVRQSFFLAKSQPCKTAAQSALLKLCKSWKNVRREVVLSSQLQTSTHREFNRIGCKTQMAFDALGFQPHFYPLTWFLGMSWSVEELDP